LFTPVFPVSTRPALSIGTRRNEALRFGAVSLEQVQQALGKPVDFIDRVNIQGTPREQRCRLVDQRAFSLNGKLTELARQGFIKNIKAGKIIPGLKVDQPFDFVLIGMTYPDNPSYKPDAVTHMTFCVQDGEIKGLDQAKQPVGALETFGVGIKKLFKRTPRTPES
jgi:hypothetical protein